LPELAQRCIESWRKFCPDYEIIEWNETNYDVGKNNYMRQAYEFQKWGFVPDFARLDIIYNHGGIYLDTDVELIKPLDSMLEHCAFAGVEKNSEYVALGLGFGACKGHPTVKAMRDYYDELSFIENGIPNLTPAPIINTAVLKKMGYLFSNHVVHACDMTIFPSEYLCPINYDTGDLELTENTYSIHHYSASWYDETQKYALTLRRKLRRLLPKKPAAILATAIAKSKFEGPSACVTWILKKRKRRISE